jgi:hypothetical protein
MKKKLFFYSVALLALSACTNDTLVDENTTVNQPKEIAFKALATPATRGGDQYAVDGMDFPTDIDMKVAAYQVGTTGVSAEVYFAETVFTYGLAGGSSSTNTTWGGATPQFWPLTPSTINFLAIANANADNNTGVVWGTNKADQVVITMADNSSAQRDLMYASGTGSVTQNADNSLNIPSSVGMAFKHAQAWISFFVQAESPTEEAITLNSITLNGSKYNGTYTVTNNNYNAATGVNATGAWSALGEAKPVVVPGWSPDNISSDGMEVVGEGLMIVPDDNDETGDFTSFTLNYSYAGHTYNYTYTPVNTNVDQTKHYIYEITFKLHEVFVNATVADWTDQTATQFTVQD